MTSCLYECLYEAGLQRYYPRFTALGLNRLVHLSQLTMEDYPRLGVQDMVDRTRLFHLVQLVKSMEEDKYEVDEGGVEEDRAVNVEGTASSRRPPPRRQLDFSGISLQPECPPFSHSDGTHTPVCRTLTDRETPIRNIRINREARRLSTHASTGTSKQSANKEMSRCSTHTATYSSRIDMETPSYTKPKREKHLDESSYRKCPLEQEVTPVYQVRCPASYNYGLPLSLPVTSSRVVGGGAMAERIRVCVRKRPLSRAEERRGEADVVTARDGESVLVHEKKEAVDLTQYVLQHAFYFDEVFSEACTNEDVYMKTAQPLIQHIFDGGKATCFAYGQTGAGKTHTMLGSSPRRPGLYALAARDIFARLVQSNYESSPVQPSGPLSVWVSFFEIYCGQLYDLLARRKRLFAREDGQRVVQIVGLKEVRVESVATLLEVISCGSRERSRGVSGVNCDSSRSHALLQIHLRDPMHCVTGRISFVDLAGSERACDTRDPDRQSRMEGAEINQSLLALKECIRALDQEHSHTPFRQSKLTQVLKDSFIGNSKTCMIANISPSHLATDHTLNTLRYADRVKELKRGGRSSPCHGRAGSKMTGTPSPKRNKHCSRGKSPSKKVKLGMPKDPRGAIAPVPLAGAVFCPSANLLCSTPKAGASLEGCGARGEVCLDHTTPLRGMLGEGAGRSQGRRERERRRTEAWQRVRGDEEERDERGARRGSLEREHIHPTRQEVPSRAQPVWKETVPRGKMGEQGEATGYTGAGGEKEHLLYEGNRWPGEESDRTREETERERHLKRYHQQLQQFQPLAAVLLTRHTQQPLQHLLALYKGSVNKPEEIQDRHEPSPLQYRVEDGAFSSSGCPGPSLAPDSLTGSSSRGGGRVRNTAGTEVIRDLGEEREPALSRRENCAGLRGTERDQETVGRDGQGYEGDFGSEEELGWWGESRRRQQVGEMEGQEGSLQGHEGYPDPLISISPGTVASLGLREGGGEKTWEREREGGSDNDSLVPSEWSSEEEDDYSVYISSESSGSNNTNNANAINSIPAERPLSPPRALNDLSAEFKHTNSRAQGGLNTDWRAEDSLCLHFRSPLKDSVNIPLSCSTPNVAEPQLADLKRDHGKSCADAPVTSPHLFKETLAIVMSSVGAEPHRDPTAVAQSNTYGPAKCSGYSPSEVLPGNAAPSPPPLHGSPVHSSPTVDTSSTTMDPLSISLLHVERQAATDSFLRCGSCSPGLSPGRNSTEKVKEEAPQLLLEALLGVDTCWDHSISAVAPGGQRGQQRINLHDSFFRMKGTPVSTDPSVSLTAFPGSFLETSAQSHSESVGLRKPAPPTGEPLSGAPRTHNLDPVGKSSSPLLSPEPRCQTQLDLPLTQSPPFSEKPHEPIPATAKSLTTQQEGCGGHLGVEPTARGGLDVQGLSISQAVVGGLGLPQELLKAGHPGKPLDLSQDLSQQSDPAASPHPQMPGTTAVSHREGLGQARRLVIQAHCEQLEEMESLCRREEALLSQQPHMDFTEYVLKLEEIMELKAKCVRSMRAQLQLYLTFPLQRGQRDTPTNT